MKPTLNRRHFLTTLGAGIVASQLPLQSCSPADNTAFTGEALKFWTDPRITKFKTPWRKIHLDFHNSHHIATIGEKFNADEWGDRLVAGNVDSIVVFAKDMHGFFYYPSKYGPVHPGLSFDLMGEQVKACRQRDIKVYGYYCATWEHNLAEAYPEWNMRRRDGSDYRPKKGETPGWTALCLGNNDFVSLMEKHIEEYMSNYDLDGAWIDMALPITAECYCKECIRQITASGKDPYDKEAQREHQNKNFLEFHRRMKELVHTTKPGSHVDFNDNGMGRLSERVDFLDNVDVEALPTGFWGYFFAPTHVRYQRNFGLPVYGMTGRFASSWADFGGLKLPQQLDVELASLVANAARCDVGDQMPPDGVLDAAVYHVLGKSFGRIKQLEPWLDQAAPVTEAALMVPAVGMQKIDQPFLYGLVKLMMESHLQFDLVEPGQDWEKYNLVVIPDELMPDSHTVGRLHQYIANGGVVLASHNGGLEAGTKQSWLGQYGLNYEGKSQFTPAYLVTEDGFVNDMPGYAYALYEGASQWKAELPAKSLCQLGEPLFQRSAEHYTSHKQTPFDHVTDYSSLATSGNVGLFGFPLGLSYYNKGYWIYRSAFEHLLKELVPQQLVETNAPVSTEITVTWQNADKETGRPERYMVHIINWSPVRKSKEHAEVHEDPIALTNVKVKLNIPVRHAQAKTVVTGLKLKHQIKNEGIEVIVPNILIHEIVCFETG